MKNSKRNIVNLIFSSFLVIGFIVCSYFFSSLAKKVAGLGGSVIHLLILLVFGLLLFYATRVGEGKQVKRFSLPVLLLLDVPCCYIILAALIKALPLHEQLAPVDGVFPVVLMLAAIALGYGIPYTFLSGYELQEEKDDNAEDDEPAIPERRVDRIEKDEPVKGGIAEEIAEADTEDEAEESADEASEDEKDDAKAETADEKADDADDEE